MKRPALKDIKKTAGEAAALLEKGKVHASILKITGFFRKNLNPDNIDGMKRFAITCRKTYGIDVPTLRIIAGNLAGSIRKSNRSGLPVIKKLWATGVLENKMITGFVFFDAAEAHLSTNKNDFKAIFSFLENIIPGFENWAVCDTICTSGLDRFWLKYPDKVLPFMFKCVNGQNIWKRRVPAATIAGYCSAANFDAKRALALIDNLIGDGRIYVFKAVTWALRNMSKRNGKDVFEYLLKLSKNTSGFRVIRSTISQGSQKLPFNLRKTLLKNL